MNKKLGKRLLYMGLPAIGIMFCLYYLSIATEAVSYTHLDVYKRQVL